ncbi:MAG TPA: prepilin-type N-terminal cleavage/methylation domain-containing protein [Bryobacteraceae bacterium]|jgi:general secretion pathway protein J|nr:prepilin-type N-terminal cleavage/methylation domain-containing protein [Bryobacteraceae bacterium]
MTPRRAFRPDAGVTLLELLIAASLLSLLSMGALMAMRVGLNALDKTNARLIDNRRVMGVDRILESQIAGIIPVVANCAATGGRFSFFEGQPAEMRFVSAYSLQDAARGYPRILEFRVTPGDRGGVRLIVNEMIYGGPFMAGQMCAGMAPDPATGKAVALFPPVQPNPNSFVLADRLAYCRFIYRQAPRPPVPEQWRQTWGDGEYLPSAIRVEMAPLEPDPSRLQVMSVTAPVRITRWLMGSYED